MKIRTKFVSNSSSTAFIVLGFIPTDEEASNFPDGYYELDRYMYDTANKNPIIGKILATYSDHELWPHGSKSLSLQELVDEANRIGREFNVNARRVKLFYGVRQ